MADTRNAATRLADGSLAGTWVLATEQTTVAFRSSSLWGLIKARGRFTQVHGEGTLDGGGALAGRMVIDVASVDTGNAKRDKHLRSTDFFDATTNCHITFIATDVSAGNDGRLHFNGELTIAGQSHPFSCEATISDVDETGFTLTASVEIDRSQWGIHWKKMGMTNMQTGVDVEARFSPA